MKTYWESGGIVPWIVNMCIRWRWVVIFTLRSLYPGARACDIQWIGGWVRRWRNPIIALIGNWTAVVHPITQSLYLLSYPQKRGVKLRGTCFYSVCESSSNNGCTFCWYRAVAPTISLKYKLPTVLCTCPSWLSVSSASRSPLL
jgi:hypothetical protein